MSPIRLIDHNQQQIGVISVDQALQMAREAGLDLVEVSPQERPPVCRIMDYGKFKYERKKRQKHASQGHTITLKEIRFRPKTDAHDREIKVNRARDFLAEGHKVQFTMLFRGRERVHRELATEAFQQILTEFGESIRVERPPSMEGRRMTMVVSPSKGTAPAQPSAPVKTEKATTEKTPAPAIGRVPSE